MWNFILEWLPFFATTIIAGLTLYNSFQIRKASQEGEKRKRILEQKLQFEKKLNELYIPFAHYLENSKTLYKIFRKNKPSNFRALNYFLNPKMTYEKGGLTLSKSDHAIFKKILEIGVKMESLIYEKGYLAGNDEEFVEAYVPREKYSKLPYIKDMSILSLLVSHIVVLRLAYNEELLGADPEIYLSFVFPNEINVRVKEKIEELGKEIGKCKGQILVTIS